VLFEGAEGLARAVKQWAGVPSILQGLEQVAKLLKLIFPGSFDAFLQFIRFFR